MCSDFFGAKYELRLHKARKRCASCAQISHKHKKPTTMTAVTPTRRSTDEGDAPWPPFRVHDNQPWGGYGAKRYPHMSCFGDRPVGPRGYRGVNASFSAAAADKGSFGGSRAVRDRSSIQGLRGKIWDALGVSTVSDGGFDRGRVGVGGAQGAS